MQRVNLLIAAQLEEVGRLLDEQGANPFRARAYRRAAATLRRLEQPVSSLVETGGLEALERLDGIGESLARSIGQILKQGRLPMLDRLRGESPPLDRLRSVPGIGRQLAERIHHQFGIETLEDLEAAAHDGRLATLPGIGPRRLAAIRDLLAQRLGRIRSGGAAAASGGAAGSVGGPVHEEPPVAEILDVDREYREKAAAGSLPTIAPKRFNPKREVWLPILHATRKGRHYTALYSNTALAHRLGRTRDWVVLYHDGGGGERICTVVTSERGPLKERRVVRGREAECADFYGHNGESGRRRGAAGGASRHSCNADDPRHPPR